MTRSVQKVKERFFVEEAAKRLNKSWIIGNDREHPDFLIAEDDHKFGLEVCEIFTGDVSKLGSMNKRAESDTQRMINVARREYEALHTILLRVEFVGDVTVSKLSEFDLILRKMDLSVYPVGYKVVVDVGAGLRVYVTRSDRPDWFNVMDRVGWVDRKPMPRISKIVSEKALGLPRYSAAVGADVRLLIVANHFFNSGKLSLEEPPALDKKGFREVYFFSYPESVIAFS